MATAGQWLEGARPRTMFLAVAPVVAGTGVAAAGDGADPVRGLLALVVALALQVGVNYANDYSDGVRGADADRVGPPRLVGSGLARPESVQAAAWGCLLVAAAAGLALAALTTWWLLVPGGAAILAAWLYTGGAHPYGYHALGEVAVFVFFGLVAVGGTAYVQSRHLDALTVVAAVPLGLLAVAVLVVNNLRDIPGDARAGKRTLAVVLGDARTRDLFVACTTLPFLAPLAITAAYGHVAALLALLALPLAGVALLPVRRGATGADLIPVLRLSGQLALTFALLLALGLALGH
ncbi:MAG: 1,4-dihydroxy-2-naphthoate polyprenyltransferase [Jatrophihabitans sp.]|nr:MAG: 1,4-dihydroxy-2-naphthoate polyprenyltransferase [Jatrophihabitans sp.]